MLDSYIKLILFGWFYFGEIWKNSRFSGRLRPDWGNTARVATAGLGSLHQNYWFRDATRRNVFDIKQMFAVLLSAPTELLEHRLRHMRHQPKQDY